MAILSSATYRLDSMPSYEITIPEIGLVKVTKKRGQTSLRIRLSPKGEVLVSAPWSLPKFAIEKYITTKTDWILENLPDYDFKIYDGLKFGRNLELKIHISAQKNRSKLISNTLHVYLAKDVKSSQEYIEKRILNAMKLEAEALILPRLFNIAKQTNHEFNQAFVKNLKSRWGSCDSNKSIILNIFLLQLPDELIDYVIIHELTHTLYMNHSKAFWEHVGQFLPDYKRLRKELKVHQPRLEQRI